MMLSAIGLIVVALVLLVTSADFLVKSASNLALKLRISPLLIGSSIVALGTSAPELVVSINAVLAQKPAMVLGNIMGSNIANILLVTGVAGVMGTFCIKTTRALRTEVIVLVVASIAFFALIWFDNGINTGGIGGIFL